MMVEDEDLQQEAIREAGDKSLLEQKAFVGIHGGVELKKGEKNRFLGEFKERVLRALRFDQVEEVGVYSEIITSIKDKEAKRLIIDSRVDLEAARDYINLAREYNLDFKKVSSSDFKGNIGLVVVSDHAVNRDDIYVEDRIERLIKKGIPKSLIQAKGEKICGDCYRLIEEKAPEELRNYKKFTWIDRLLGKKCSGED